MNYWLSRVPGSLAFGEWGDPGSPAVLAIHGITANHLAWAAVARALPGFHVIAPDLRGRGGSRDLGGPYCMDAHAADLAAVLDHLGVPSATVVGHSMGAFAALVFGLRHPGRTAATVLVDGGLPLVLPPGVGVNDTLGPAAERLTMEFADRTAYRALWKAHPALAGAWNADIEAYVDYDLVGEAPRLHSSASYEAMALDSADLFGTDAVDAALAALPAGTPLLTAPRGLLDADPLYSPEALAQWRARLPGLVVSGVPDVNHYTIVMGRRGAAAVAAAVAVAGRPEG
ncbi:alpha/beta hydrolase [Arthrobacter livingstonensis]|uniref:Alpha/beta hydrolase n=1 Tax=Arthrobacter livingstonensis TaxID=670078 RepID=A0A2V5LSP6_9MICC|nr:alpha/beta hydrolase [Arthrobacter livingstonensis]PYI66087.1 alpha/beta hydrolase [Arthrobacter livingstonensis]